MGYRSDIRINVSTKGLEKLKKFVAKYLKENNEDYNLLDEYDVKQEGKGQCYIGWNYLKWYDGYAEVDAIMNGLEYLKENEYLYRYMRIGEEYDDIEEESYDGNKDDLYLEYPYIIREFDDEYINSVIKTNNKQCQLEENKEEIDI